MMANYIAVKKLPECGVSLEFFCLAKIFGSLHGRQPYDGKKATGMWQILAGEAIMITARRGFHLFL